MHADEGFRTDRATLGAPGLGEVGSGWESGVGHDAPPTSNLPAVVGETLGIAWW